MGARLQLVRDWSGLSARELDRLAGLAEGHTSLIESGSRPSVETRTAEKLARVVGSTLDWLISGVGRRPSKAKVLASVAAARKTAAALQLSGAAVT